LLVSCTPKKKEINNISIDLNEIVKSDTLRVATMYGSTSYFLYRDEMMGFDYEMVGNLAKYLKLNLKITISKSEDEMVKWLQEGKVDIIAYNIIQTKSLKKSFSFVLPQSESYQVLVQKIDENKISSVTELAGKNVTVKKNSIFSERINTLNEEIGGKINVIAAADSVTSEDLIEMVGEGKISYTLAYHNTAMLYKSYYKKMDCRLEVGFKQSNGWLIRNGSIKLKKSIENWQNQSEVEEFQTFLLGKYWNKSPYFSQRTMKTPKGAISPYDQLFKKYAKLIGWDWRMLASLAFHESRFDALQKSWSGASGLMQLMPRTASNFGLNRLNVFDPEMNIEAGVQYIKSLNMSFGQVENKEERIKFILAGYNCGPAHIIDAMALAKKFGKNPHIWYGNVEFYLLKKSEPEFYNDKVVRYGYFRGKTTVGYVKNAVATYENYLKR
jgi:membrane-bound lytic murein transglycosylase F